MSRPPGPSLAARIAALIAVLTLLLAACGDDGEASPRGPELVGPLCDLLPQPGEPAGPEALTGLNADEALTWIPVLTNFEAGARASGLDDDLADIAGVTILAPSDEAFTAALSQDTIDSLLLFRHDEMRTLLESHMIEGRLTLDELREAGSVTTLAGETIAVEPTGNMVSIDDRAETVCAGYEVHNATIHVVNGVLGELPEPAEEQDDVGGG